MGQVK